MVGVTAFARFAGLAALPAFLPRFAKAAWLDIQPEFNPFKYNSFPVNAARQTHRLTAALQVQIDRLAAAGRLGPLPPVLTFQSVVDATVSTPAVLAALYQRLPANGSEIVLFDLNRSQRFGPLFGATAATTLDRILPPPPRRYAVTLIGNARPDDLSVVARRWPANTGAASTAALERHWPMDLFSLSHVALPFPRKMGLWTRPDPSEDFGVQLGASPYAENAACGEGLDTCPARPESPFFPYRLERVTRRIRPVAIAERECGRRLGWHGYWPWLAL